MTLLTKQAGCNLICRRETHPCNVGWPMYCSPSVDHYIITYCNWRAICARFACRSGCVVHGGMSFWWKKLFPFGPIVRFKLISNSQWSLITLRDVARHASGATRALSSIFSLCAVPVGTLCVLATILAPCTFKSLWDRVHVCFTGKCISVKPFTVKKIFGREICCFETIRNVHASDLVSLVF
jgi:hypothetical protein